MWAVESSSLVPVIVGGTANTIAQAVDFGGDSYWLFAWDATLRSHDDGLLTEKENIIPPTTPSGGDISAMAVDIFDGSVLLGFASKLYHYSSGGKRAASPSRSTVSRASFSSRSRTGSHTRAHSGSTLRVVQNSET